MQIHSELIERPLEFVRREFEQNNSITPSLIEKLYFDVCTKPSELLKIKSLNKTSINELKAGEVVHFRCMVQDMYDSEFFFKVYNISNKENGCNFLRCGLYQDIIQHKDNEAFAFESPHNKYGDRQVLYCVPVPGENDWAKSAHNDKFADHLKLSSVDSSNGIKRKLRDDDDESIEMKEEMELVVRDDSCPKRVKSDNHRSVETRCYNYKENFPLPNELGYPAIVKVYDADAGIGLNDTVDVFGVLSLDSNLADLSSEGTEAAMDCDVVELMARNPHPIIVPRLHALIVRKLESDHPFHLSPILDDVSSFGRCREQIMTIFNHCFHGDELASEYLLCHLLSGVYARRDMMALGKFSLNVSNIRPSSNFVGDFYQVLSQILNKSHLFPMTLENMNGLDLVPSKDYEENRLKPGILQLSERTHLVIDETLLQPGKLDEKGVLNVAALASVLEKQELGYNFKFHTQSYQTNIRVLVLSEGKSILNCDCHVPLVKAHENQSLNDLRGFLTNPVLNLIRGFLCHAENIVPTMPLDVQEEVEKDFVENRRNASDKMAPEDLHASLTLARYVALSQGSNVIGLDLWRYAQDMERQRKERIKKLQDGK